MCTSAPPRVTCVSSSVPPTQNCPCSVSSVLAASALPYASRLQMLLMLSDDEIAHIVTFLHLLIDKVSVERVCRRLQAFHKSNILARDHEDVLAAAIAHGFSHTQQCVDIHCVQITTMAKSLKVNAVLNTLWLSNNQIGPTGAVALAGG